VTMFQPSEIGTALVGKRESHRKERAGSESLSVAEPTCASTVLDLPQE
jgi:hypothetical protein